MDSNERPTPTPGDGANTSPQDVQDRVADVLDQVDQLADDDIDGKSALLHQAHDLLTDALTQVDRVR